MAAALELLGAPSLFRSPRHIVQAALTQAAGPTCDAIPQEVVRWLWRFYISLNEMNMAMPARGKAAAAAEGPELVRTRAHGSAREH